MLQIYKDVKLKMDPITSRYFSKKILAINGGFAAEYVHLHDWFFK